MLEMKCPESCKGCYREQTCELWKSTPLRQDIEAEGCGCLNEEVFGDSYLPDWCWGPVEEDAPAPVYPAVVKIEDGRVCRIVLEWDRYWGNTFDE